MLQENYFEKKIEQYNLLINKRKYLRAVTSLYNMYGVALAILKIKDENYNTKRRLWKRMLGADDKEDGDHYYAKLEVYMQQDFLIVLEAHDKLKDMKNTSDFHQDSINKLGVCAVLSYVHPTYDK